MTITVNGTYPHLGAPCTSLSRSGPVRFLANAVGIIGTGLTGVARILVAMVIAPTVNIKDNINNGDVVMILMVVISFDDMLMMIMMLMEMMMMMMMEC